MSSPFENLPLELRVMVYAHLLTPTYREGYNCIKLGSSGYRIIKYGLKLAILSVNKKINSEAAAVFYRRISVMIFYNSSIPVTNKRDTSSDVLNRDLLSCHKNAERSIIFMAYERVIHIHVLEKISQINIALHVNLHESTWSYSINYVANLLVLLDHLHSSSVSRPQECPSYGSRVLRVTLRTGYLIWPAKDQEELIEEAFLRKPHFSVERFWEVLRNVQPAKDQEKLIEEAFLRKPHFTVERFWKVLRNVQRCRRVIFTTGKGDYSEALAANWNDLLKES